MDAKLERSSKLLRFFRDQHVNSVASRESTELVWAIKYGRDSNRMLSQLYFLKWLHPATLELFWAPAMRFTGRVHRSPLFQSGHPTLKFIPLRSFLRRQLFLLNMYCLEKTGIVNDRRKQRNRRLLESLGFSDIIPQLGDSRFEAGGIYAEGGELAAQFSDHATEADRQVLHHTRNLLRQLEAKGYPVARMVSTLLRNSHQIRSNEVGRRARSLSRGTASHQRLF